MDKVEWALIGIVACVIAIVGLAIADQVNNNNAVNAWTARCNRDGGVVEIMRYGFTHNDLECIKNGKIIDPQN